MSLAAAQPPNVVFIITDDLGYGDVGVLFQNQRAESGIPGKPWESTPNLDRFAVQGAQLRDHYCPAPVCAPSRSSLMTGLTQGHANVRNNQFDKAIDNNHTLATVLDQAGYATVAIGKWGLEGAGLGEDSPATWPAFPTKRGFDYFFGYAQHKNGHEHYPKEGVYTGSQQVWDGTNEISSGLDKCYTTDLWTARAKQWIVNHEHTNSSQPFFIYLAYETPHAVTEYPSTAYPAGGGLKGGMQWLGVPHHMINTADGKVDSYVDPAYASAMWNPNTNQATPLIPWPDIAKRYATSVRRIDDAVGDMVQLLKDLNIDSNTIVIFTSDNGAFAGSYEQPRFFTNEPPDILPTFFASYGPFDGIKRDCWEGGIRVPMLVRWPGHIPAGKIITRPSALYDWLPTLADLAGLPAPARADGVSLLPELTGVGTQRDRGYIYIEYYEKGRTPKYKDFFPAHRGRERGQMQVITLDGYLGVRYDIQSQADPFEIYNVTVDSHETNNMAAQMPAMEQRMKNTVLQVRRPNASAPRPYDNELVPAVAVSSATSGVDWKAYQGDFPWVPDLEALTPISHGVAARPDLEKRTRDNEIGMLFSGYLNIPGDGDYTFYLAADTGALLRIHDANVIDADFGYQGGAEVRGTIKLQKGFHPFRLFYSRRTNGVPSLNFSWSGPGIARQPVPEQVFSREGMETR